MQKTFPKLHRLVTGLILLSLFTGSLPATGGDWQEVAPDAPKEKAVPVTKEGTDGLGNTRKIQGQSDWSDADFDNAANQQIKSDYYNDRDLKSIQGDTHDANGKLADLSAKREANHAATDKAAKVGIRNFSTCVSVVNKTLVKNILIGAAWQAGSTVAIEGIATLAGKEFDVKNMLKKLGVSVAIDAAIEAGVYFVGKEGCHQSCWAGEDISANAEETRNVHLKTAEMASAGASPAAAANLSKKDVPSKKNLLACRQIQPVTALPTTSPPLCGQLPSPPGSISITQGLPITPPDPACILPTAQVPYISPQLKFYVWWKEAWLLRSLIKMGIAQGVAQLSFGFTEKHKDKKKRGKSVSGGSDKSATRSAVVVGSSTGNSTPQETDYSRMLAETAKTYDVNPQTLVNDAKNLGVDGSIAKNIGPKQLASALRNNSLMDNALKNALLKDVASGQVSTLPSESKMLGTLAAKAQESGNKRLLSAIRQYQNNNQGDGGSGGAGGSLLQAKKGKEAMPDMPDFSKLFGGADRAPAGHLAPEFAPEQSSTSPGEDFLAVNENIFERVGKRISSILTVTK